MDNAYPIETAIASKNGWFTPDESRSYYGRYARDGVCIHWWGGDEDASKHDAIVNYLRAQATQGAKSANYVVSDDKITMLVNPDNVAWCQESGNATEVSFECQPTLGAEGYKKAGWLKWQLEGRYGKQLQIHGHNFWWQTSCPGSLDLTRIEAECRKWAGGGYNPAPVSTPTPPPHADLEWKQLDMTTAYRTKLQPTSLWNVDQTDWAGFKTPVKQFNIGEEFVAYGRIINRTLGGHYLVTQYSFDKRIPNGVNEVDLELEQQPTPPTPPMPSPVPNPVPPPAPSPSPKPEPVPGPAPEPDRNAIIAFLSAIRDMITAFLARFK